MKITIGIPSRGICSIDFAVSLKLLDIPSDEFHINHISGAEISMSRNTIVEEAIKNKSDYLFFLDDDIIPPLDTIKRLLNHNKEVTTGLYYKRGDFTPCIFTRMWGKFDEPIHDGEYTFIDPFNDNLLEVDACGAGCLLIDMKVFKEMNRPYFQTIPKSDTQKEKGEDMFFCENVIGLGYKIYCDPTIVPFHIGQKFINKSSWEEFKSKTI